MAWILARLVDGARESISTETVMDTLIMDDDWLLEGSFDLSMVSLGVPKMVMSLLLNVIDPVLMHGTMGEGI